MDSVNAKNAFIVGNLATVIRMVDNLLERCSRFEYLREDLICAGNLALVESATKIFSKDGLTGDGVRKYAITAISRAIRRACDDDPAFGVSTMEKCRRRAAGKESGDVCRRDFEVLKNLIDSGEHLEFKAGTEPSLPAELAECCKDEIDLEMIDLKLSGKTQAEIATELGMSRPTLRKLQEAYARRWKTQFALSA